MEIVRESIVVSSLRSFAKTSFGILGAIFGLFIAFIIMTFFSTSQVIYPERLIPMIHPDAKGQRNLLPSKSPVILNIRIEGEIGTRTLNQDRIEEVLLSSREGMFSHDRIKGIFLTIDSPGGSAFDSEAIYEMIRTYKEQYNVPVVAYIDGLCASGGMFIASSADEIHATGGSIIGSVGVISGPSFNVSQFLDTHGVQALTLTQGKDKDALNPFRPWKPDEADNMKMIMAALYDRFVNAVSSNRPNLSSSKLRNDYGANIYIAKQAKEYGYIDEDNSSYPMALNALTKRAGIDQHEYQVFELKAPTSVLKDIVESKSALLQGKLEHSLKMTSSEVDQRHPALFLYQPSSR